MLGASFYTFVYWFAFGAVVVYLLRLVAREVDRRKRLRVMRERRLRRRYLDSLEPKRWQP